MVISLGLLLSWSRGAWLAFAVAVAVVILAHTRRAAPVVLVAVTLAVVFAAVFGLVDLLPASLVNRVSDLQQFVGLVNIRSIEVTDANFSVIERIAHWQAALGMWADHPWLGVGIGNFATAYPAYNLPRWYEPLGHAHNVYLNFGAEAGLLGFVAYLALWIACLWQAVRAAAVSNRFIAAVGAGVLGALTHATIHNLFDNLWVQHMYLNLALFLGLLAVLTTNGRQPAANPNQESLFRMSQTLNSEAPTVLWRRLLQRISVTVGMTPKELTRFVKFAFVGVIGMVVDLTILTISREILGLPLSLAVALGFTVAVVSNFTWNRFWTFPESRQRPIATQLVQFALVNLVGLGINEVIVLGLYPVFLRLSHDPIAYLAAKVIAIGVVLFWNYGANRIWTYKGIK